MVTGDSAQPVTNHTSQLTTTTTQEGARLPPPSRFDQKRDGWGHDCPLHRFQWLEDRVGAQMSPVSCFRGQEDQMGAQLPPLSCFRLWDNMMGARLPPSPRFRWQDNGDSAVVPPRSRFRGQDSGEVVVCTVDSHITINRTSSDWFMTSRHRLLKKPVKTGLLTVTELE